MAGRRASEHEAKATFCAEQTASRFLKSQVAEIRHLSSTLQVLCVFLPSLSEFRLSQSAHWNSAGCPCVARRIWTT
jgi:hypothetical protein